MKTEWIRETVVSIPGRHLTLNNPGPLLPVEPVKPEGEEIFVLT